MDIARPERALQKKRRRILYGSLVAAAVLLVTLGLARLNPAAPSVARASVWVDTVKPGPMVRGGGGLGSLVREDIRWIPATTEGRVEKIDVHPGTKVAPDTVIVELSNPEVELTALNAESQYRAAQASYAELKVRLESQKLDRQAVAAQVE